MIFLVPNQQVVTELADGIMIRAVCVIHSQQLHRVTFIQREMVIIRAGHVS